MENLEFGKPIASGTRSAILKVLKVEGPQNAKSLGEVLEVTPMGARQHLYDLRAQGLVEYSEEPRPVGRPAKMWRLTRKADRYFPDRHSELIVQILEAVRQTMGEEGMEGLLAIRKKQQSDMYRERLSQHGSLREKVVAMAEIRTEEGYMADVEEEGGGGYLLVENHCPICEAATACVGLCAVELEVFREAFGPRTLVDRVDHILAGARRCTYSIRMIE